MKRVCKFKVNTITNEQGEILGERKSNSYIHNEPPFIKAYVTDLLNMKSLAKTDINIMLGLLTLMDYHNIIDLNSRRKLELASEMETTVKTIDNSLSRICKTSDFITRISRGSYLVNPKYFAKGYWSDIEKIKTTIEYNKDGRTFITTIFDRTNKNI